MSFLDTWRAGGTGKGAYIFKPRTVSEVAVSVDGLASSADTDVLLRVRKSDGTVVFSVTNAGNLSFAGSGTISVDTNIVGSLTVSGNTTLGNASSDTTTITGDVTLNNALTITGLATFNGNVIANNDLTVYDTFTADGLSVFNNSALFENGSAADPSISFFTNQTTGLYLAASNQIGFAVNGAVELTLNATNLSPGTNDGLAIGVSGTGISDIFLASGAVINFAAGDLTLTHSSNLLSVAGGDFQMLVGNKMVIQNPNGSNPYIYGSDAGGGSNIRITNTSDVIVAEFRCDVQRVGINITDATAALHVVGIAVAGGLSSLIVAPAAHTALTAEVIDFSFAAHTSTLTDTTTIALQRSMVLGASTYNGVAAGGTETITTAINLEVALPVQGTNLTITNAPIAARFLGNTVIGNILTPAAGPTNTLFVASGTAPSSTVNDSVAFYSSDISAGNTCPSFYVEGTGMVATGQADSASSVRIQMRVNGTLYTFLCI